MATLEVRNELFDHWVGPNQSKITEKSLIILFKSLYYIKQCHGKSQISNG